MFGLGGLRNKEARINEVWLYLPFLPAVTVRLKGTPSIPETYLSSSVAWGLNLRVGWWRQILKKCKFSNQNSGRIVRSTAIAIQACRSCSRALDAVPGIPQSSKAENLLNQTLNSVSETSKLETCHHANDLGQRSHCIRSHGLLASYNFSLIILAES